MNQDVKLTHREWVKKAWGFGTFLSTVVQEKAAHSPCSHTKLRCDLQSHPHKKHDRGTQKRKQAVVCPVMQGAHTVQYGHDQVMPCPAQNRSRPARGHNKCASKLKFYRARIKCHGTKQKYVGAEVRKSCLKVSKKCPRSVQEVSRKCPDAGLMMTSLFWTYLCAQTECLVCKHPNKWRGGGGARAQVSA